MSEQNQQGACEGSAVCTCHHKETPRSAQFQADLKKRLNRAIGQLNGVKDMLDDNRYCGDVLIQLAAAERAASIWQQRYETLHDKYIELKKKAQPYLDALEAAGEKVRTFVHDILARARGEHERKHPRLEHGRDTEL